MKDSLFEMLMSFFETSLSKIIENKSTANNNPEAEDVLDLTEISDTFSTETSSLVVRAAHDKSIRVFTYDEQMKLTKASYQFLMRLLLWGIIAPERMESIINQLLFSESRFVTLEETKWTIRNVLAENLDSKQLVFLDLVLYQKEDELPLH